MPTTRFSCSIEFLSLLVLFNRTKLRDVGMVKSLKWKQIIAIINVGMIKYVFTRLTTNTIPNIPRNTYTLNIFYRRTLYSSLKHCIVLTAVVSY